MEQIISKPLRDLGVVRTFMRKCRFAGESFFTYGAFVVPFENEIYFDLDRVPDAEVEQKAVEYLDKLVVEIERQHKRERRYIFMDITLWKFHYDSPISVCTCTKDLLLTGKYFLRHMKIFYEGLKEPETENFCEFIRSRFMTGRMMVRFWDRHRYPFNGTEVDVDPKIIEKFFDGAQKLTPADLKAVFEETTTEYVVA